MSPSNLALRFGKGRQRGSSDLSKASTPSAQPEAPAISATQNTTVPPNLLGLNLLTPVSDDDNLHLPPESPDVVAIHGINGDPYRTWTHSNGKLWLRDFLAPKIPGCRVFSFGYDAQVVFTKSRAALGDYARSLLNGIKVYRRESNQQHRPLIFICHSMGGLVVKKALVIATLDEYDYPFIKSSVKGIVFLGTPHRGSDAVTLPLIVLNIARVGCYFAPHLSQSFREDLLKSLQPNSPELVDIAEQFRNRVKGVKIISCYESDTTKPLGTIIVDKQSATLNLPDEMLIPMMGCDHHTISCFASENDNNYMSIFSEIGNMISQ